MAEEARIDPSTLVAVGRLSAELGASAKAQAEAAAAQRAFIEELRGLKSEAELLGRTAKELTEHIDALSLASTKPSHGGTIDLKLGKASLYRALATLAVAVAAAFGGAQLLGQNNSPADPKPQVTAPGPKAQPAQP